MHLKVKLLKLLKILGGDTRRAIVGYIFLGLIAAGGGLWTLTKIGLNWVTQIANTATPLWVTIALILLCGLYTILRLRQHQHSYNPPPIEEELREELGVYWNSQDKSKIPAG